MRSRKPSVTLASSDLSSSSTGVGEARLHMFARQQRHYSYDSIPPTQPALREHAKRDAYQAGVIWGQVTCADPDIGSPADWGWMKTEEMWNVCWTKLPPIATSCQELPNVRARKAAPEGVNAFILNLPVQHSATARVNSRTVRKTRVFQLVQYMCSNGQLGLSNILYRFACDCWQQFDVSHMLFKLLFKTL